MALAQTGPGLTERVRGHAEWRPWLDLLDAARAEAAEPTWRDFVPEIPVPSPPTPMLAGVTVALDARALRRWMRRLLLATARHAGPPATLSGAAAADVAYFAALLEAGVAQDTTRVAELAAAQHVDAGALGAVAMVAPVPLLRACAARWMTRVSASWDAGFCPVCGAWPTLAEARGLERARRLRCVRCAADWRTAWLRCVFCGADDHTNLGSLVLTVERPGDPSGDLARVASSIDTCEVCRGYLKTLTTLGPTPADDLALLDLATVELDIAALEHGYARPAGSGTAVGIRVTTAAGNRLAAWWRS
jgi:FdhE protein